jgi:C4-dicarboxylate-binding protein DctP
MLKIGGLGMRGIIFLVLLLLVAGLIGSCANATAPKEVIAPATKSEAPSAEPKPASLWLAIQAYPIEPPSVVTEEFALSFNEIAAGRAEIVVYDRGSLGMSNQYLDMLRTGAIDIAIFPLGHIEKDAPVFTAPGLPFIFKNTTACAAAIEPMADAVFNDIFENQFNQRPLGWAPTSTPNIGSAKKPVRVMEDYNDMLIAVTSPAQFKSLEVLGAEPVNVSGPNLLGAFEKGIIDAVLMPVDGAMAMKLYDVINYWTVSEMLIGSVCMNINLDALYALPEDLRSALFEKSKEWGIGCRDSLFAAEAAMTEQMAQVGVEIYVLPDEERAKCEAACRPIWYEYVNEAGPDGEVLIAIAQEANRTSQ